MHLEASISKMTDAQLAAKTPYFREKLAQGAALEDIYGGSLCRRPGSRPA